MGALYHKIMTMMWSTIWFLYMSSMAQCKTAGIPVRRHWIYCSLTLSHRLVVTGINSFILICRSWYHNATMYTLGLLLMKIYHFDITQPDPAWFFFGKSDISFFMYPVSVPYPMLATTHYCNVIMGAMASQITSLTNVDSNAQSGADQRKHLSSVSLAFVRGINRPPGNSTHKWPA